MNIVIAAVGGQGGLFAARVIGAAALAGSFEVKVSEVHGMSQRGGSVSTYVRYGKEVASPIVEEGCADVVIAFEMLEGSRALPYLKPGGSMILNTQRINPLPVLTGGATYPENLPRLLRSTGISVATIDAQSLAKECGNSRAVNAVMLGALAKTTGDISQESWKVAIEKVSKPEFTGSNLAAFDKGFAQ
jgi:indolepyruvate ferredoxin oxidoreductase beta subunit